MAICYQCGTDEPLRHVTYKAAGDAVIVEEDLCTSCYDDADSYSSASINGIEVVDIIKES